MRILIVGGGVAGLTLAGKLLQQGRVPVIVEKAPEYADIGYGIGLYPLGNCVLHGLGVFDQFLRVSEPSTTYEIADQHGRVLQSADMAAFTAGTGPVAMIARMDLIELLLSTTAGSDLRMGVSVERITQPVAGATGPVSVELSDGTAGEFDLVVAADGLKSQTRSQVFADPETFDTGWVIWTWWSDQTDWPKGLVREHLAAGSFFGMYPCGDRVMCAAGMPAATAGELAGDLTAAQQLVTSQHQELIEADPRIGRAIESAQSFFPWPMSDVRSHDWIKGRVALCGDAADGFLPTAGVGASNAMRGAAALADELSRTGARTLPLALSLYEKRARKIIQANQDDSRAAAKYMFVSGRAKAWSRDQLVKHYPAQRITAQIVKSMQTPF